MRYTPVGSRDGDPSGAGLRTSISERFSVREYDVGAGAGLAARATAVVCSSLLLRRSAMADLLSPSGYHLGP